MIFYPDSKVKAFQLRLNTPSSSTTSNNRWLHHLKASKVVDHMHDRQFYIYNYNHSSVTVLHARVWVRVCVWVFVLCLSLWVCAHVWKVCLCFLHQENVKSQSNIYNYNHSSVTVLHARVWVRVFVLCLSLWVCACLKSLFVFSASRKCEKSI